MSFQVDYLNRLEGDLRAAAVRRRRRRPARRWALLVAPRALLLGALVVLMGGSLAFAFGSRVLTAIGITPAPKSVKSEFRNMVKPPVPKDGTPPFFSDFMPGNIVPGSEHLVLSMRRPDGHVARIYAARTTRGQICTTARGWPFENVTGGGSGCWPKSAARGPFSILDPASYTRQRNDTRRTLFGRTASSQAATVRVVYPDGTHDDVALQDGWFIFDVPAAHAQRATAPIRLDVLSASGARLGSFTDPFLLRYRPPHFTKPVPSSVQLLARAELPNDGGTVAISSGQDAQGRNCFRHLRDGKSQIFPVWECSAAVGHYSYPVYPANRRQVEKHVAIRWQWGARNDQSRPTGYGYVYATGWVAPDVASLVVRFQDGGAADVQLHDGYYVYVVPPANWPAGRRPSILEARDAQGRVVYREFLYPRQHCIYPGRDSLCRNTALASG